ncbi:hypothetical protein RHGRI_013289 [Rhododendron griersonianum]|uniref:Uncharacterized protein n=1 Tax=Rhododendron griersonianum TaxID=479676 RepID=A0AAV6K503_9ERIC|nr:hypothetical protein RHGRI_013289 [Rhododendron griersonianum]
MVEDRMGLLVSFFLLYIEPKNMERTTSPQEVLAVHISHSIYISSFPYSQLEREMDSSPLKSKSNYHARSVSLPSRLHPLIPHIDEHLNLDGLQNMCDRLDDLLLLPHTQLAFAQQQEETWVEEVLEKYLRLLDICSAARDVSTQTKQDVQNLLSILRRRRDTNDFAGYVTSRKKAKKEIQKSLKELKSIKSKTIGIASDKSHAWHFRNP